LPGLLLRFPAGKTKLSVVLPLRVIGESEALFLRQQSWIRLTLTGGDVDDVNVIEPNGTFTSPGDTFYRQIKSLTMSEVYTFAQPRDLVLRLTYTPFDPSRALFDGKIDEVLLNSEGGSIVMEQVL
jgi:hypothetical protein